MARRGTGRWRRGKYYETRRGEFVDCREAGWIKEANKYLRAAALHGPCLVWFELLMEFPSGSYLSIASIFA